MRNPLLLIILIIGCSGQAPGLEKPSAKPGGEFMALTADGAWCWFQDPRAVYHSGEHSRTYAGWVDSGGNISVRHYDHATGELGPVNVLRDSLLHDGRPDDHDVPAFLVLPGGRLQAFYSPHSGNPMWYRVARNPEDVTAWGQERVLGTNTGDDGWGFTYPNPSRLAAEERIYLFWRGGTGKPSYSTSPDGLNWARAEMLIEGPGVRPYVKYVSDGDDEIHIAFTDGHPRREPENSIYYARYYRDALWRSPVDDRIAGMDELPIAPKGTAVVYDGATRGRAWIWDIALDADDRPVMVYSVMPDKREHYYHYARWDGQEWREHRITLGGPWFPETTPGEEQREPHYSGGVVLDHRDPSVAYLSRQVNGVFEIERWETADNGATWNSNPVTAGSTADNVRPLVARARPGEPSVLFWMHGSYDHYTRFDTSIRMLPLAAE